MCHEILANTVLSRHKFGHNDFHVTSRFQFSKEEYLSRGTIDERSWQLRTGAAYRKKVEGRKWRVLGLTTKR